MDRQIINFSANEQSLIKTGGVDHYAGNIVRYIEAHFDLGANWTGYDSVRAIWRNKRDVTGYSTVLNSEGVCIVPFEVLTMRGDVCMNLVGSIVENDVLVDRLTTYPICALTIDVPAMVDGSDPASITPSEYEQFVASVRNDADRAETGATASEASASEASASAEQATASAQASEASALRSASSAQNAQNSERNASEYAQDAHISAQNAETFALDAEEAKRKILSMRAEATTLAEGSQATASYSNGVLTLGIPKGDTGARGEKGETGETGATPNFSIGTVETLEPNESATASITGTAENPVLNLGLPQGRTGEVTYEDLESILPRDTATGNPITITDGQSVIPVKSLEVELEPIQDLHGYDKPWTGGAGVNKLIPNTPHTQTVSGVTWTINADGSVTARGTATERSVFNYISPSIGGYTFNGDYRMKFFPSISSSVMGCGLYINNWYSIYPNTVNNVNGAEGQIVKLWFSVIEGQTIDTTFYPIIYSASVTEPTAWTPYGNICPISGHTEVVTQRTGVNVWDEEWEVGTLDASTGANQASSIRIRSKNFIPILPNTEYCYEQSQQGGRSSGRACYYDKDKNFISGTTSFPSGSSGFVTPATFVTPDGAYFMKFSPTSEYGTTYKNDISINYPSTDHDYHAYNGNTYTTALGRTVYGGTLDVVSGELTIDRKGVTFDGSSDEDWRPYSGQRFVVVVNDYTSPLTSVKDNITSNYLETVYKGAQGTRVGVISGGDYTYHQLMVNMGLNSVAEMREYLAQNPLQVVYPLATPQTIQLTPQQVMLLHGNNNVWSDGEVTMVYNADVGLYIDKKLYTSGTRTLSMTKNTKSEETELTKSDAELTKSDNIQLAGD